MSHQDHNIGVSEQIVKYIPGKLSEKLKTSNGEKRTSFPGRPCLIRRHVFQAPGMIPSIFPELDRGHFETAAEGTAEGIGIGKTGKAADFLYRELGGP